MLAAMLRQSSGGGSGGGGGGGTKLSLGISRLSSSSMSSAGPARASKSGSVSLDNPDVLTSDPNYIMQLVSDVRKFADVKNTRGFINLFLPHPPPDLIYQVSEVKTSSPLHLHVMQCD